MLLVTLILIVLALIGTPLFAVIGASAMLGFYSIDVDLSVIAIEFYRLAEMPILLAIPLFTFAGYLLSESRAAERLVLLSDSLLGWMPGGLAIVSLMTCALFTAFTGASGITIIALGALLYPALKQGGYHENFSLGLVTTSGSLGLLFAPSLPLILYAIVAQQLGLGLNLSVDEMFRAGILPGLLMLVLLSIWIFWNRIGHPVSAFSAQQAISAMWQARWELPLPIIVLGGVYSGFFAISEAAAVTVIYILFVEMALYRDISIRQLPKIMRSSMVLVGAILLVLGMSLASTNYMIDAGIPTMLFEKIGEYVDSRITFLILLNIFLLILGTMLDIFSALMIMIPLLLPIAIGYGIDPVHLGIIFLANMQIGYFTPPVGMNLFIASYRFKKPVMQLYRATWPFFVILMISVIMITYLPAISLWLAGRY